MVLDYSRSPLGKNETLFQNSTVTVDGKPILLAWYIDTTEGIVKTYDVQGDGKAHSSVVAVSSREAERLSRGIWSLTLRGKVEVIPCR